MTRREFLRTAAVSGGAAVTGLAASRSVSSAEKVDRPNILLIMTDQQGLDTISALGCRDVRTPNMDRLVESGVSFAESYCTNPVCSPARSSILTGRMPCETGVVRNTTYIRPDVPNLGQWLGRFGYETTYVGKWHLAHGFTNNVPGFTVLPGGLLGQGTLCDAVVSATCAAYLRSPGRSRPFLLVASLLQPHDICQWVSMNAEREVELPYPELADELPALPPNFDEIPSEPEWVERRRSRSSPDWSELQWRYYVWSYLRMVEEVDAEIGRILKALDASGERDRTIVVFTSDHGEGRGRHRHVLKSVLYDEAAKVPLVFSAPGRIREALHDREHLVSGLDIVPTVCDLAEVEAPPRMRGVSLRPVLEGSGSVEREFVVAASRSSRAHMLRSGRYKYVTYPDDPVEQLFDVRKDPWETRNLARRPDCSEVLAKHRSMLAAWNARMDRAEKVRGIGG